MPEADRHWDRVARLGVLALFSLALALHAVAHSHFRVDDYAHFALSARIPLVEFVARPIDVHFAPLHRLVTAALYALFPMRFDVAVALLAACHVAAFALLDRLLERLHPGVMAGWLLPLFAASVYAIVPLSYWTSGLHRFPFTLLCIACLYAYLRFRDTGGLGALLGAFAAFLLAMGFYSKAALIPATLVALEAGLWWRPAAVGARGRGLALTAFAAGLGLYALAYTFHPRGFEPLTPSLDPLLETLGHGLRVVAALPFALVTAPETPFGPWLPTIWASVAALSVFVAPRNALVWVGFGGLIVLHLAMIGLSARAHDLGAMTAYVYRYYYELALPVVLLLALSWRNCAESQRWRLPQRRATRWLASRWLAVAFTAGYAAFAYHAADALMAQRYGVNQLARDYITTLTSELERLEREVGPRPMLVDGAVPRFMWVYDATLRRHSSFLPLIGADAIYDTPGDVLHWIDADGRAHRLKTTERFAIDAADIWVEAGHEVQALARDESGCLVAKSEDGGRLWIGLQSPVLLSRGMVVVEFADPSPETVWVNLTHGDGRSLWPARGLPLELPPGAGARLLDVVMPAGRGPIRVNEIVLFVPPGDTPLCLEAVRLTTYALAD